MEIRATTTLRHNKLIEYREHHGLSQKEMSNLCGVPFCVYQDIERLNFKRKNIEQLMDYINFIAEYTSIPVYEILPEKLRGVTIPSRFATVKNADVNKLLDIVDRTERRLILPAPDAEPEDILLQTYPPEIINKAIETLSYRQREIIKLRFGINGGIAHTLKEVGKIFKVTCEVVRQIEARACRKLSRFLENYSKHGSFLENPFFHTSPDLQNFSPGYSPPPAGTKGDPVSTPHGTPDLLEGDNK